MLIPLFINVGGKQYPIEVGADARMVDVVEEVSKVDPTLIGKVFQFGGKSINYFTSLSDAGIGSESTIEVNQDQIDLEFERIAKVMQNEIILKELARIYLIRQIPEDDSVELWRKQQHIETAYRQLDSQGNAVENESDLFGDRASDVMEQLRQPRTTMRSILWKMSGRDGKNFATASSGDAIDRLINIGKAVNTPQNYRKEVKEILKELHKKNSR